MNQGTVPRRRRQILPFGLPLHTLTPPDAREIARLLREQTPQQPPPASARHALAGLVAWDLLGYRVIRSVQE